MSEDDGSDPTTRLPALTRPDDATGASIPLTFGPTVTLFFSDIRGFTEYTDEGGDAAAFRMLQFHNTMMQEQIALYGGHIVKRLGDSFMVSFDAARNAMACGIGVQKSLAQHNEQEDVPSGVRVLFGRTLMGVDKLFDDFAVELRGKVLSSTEGTRFGFQYLPTSSESISFTLVLGTSNYIVTHGMNQQFQALSTGKSTALVAPGEENLILSHSTLHYGVSIGSTTSPFLRLS